MNGRILKINVFETIRHIIVMCENKKECSKFFLFYLIFILFNFFFQLQKYDMNIS